MSTLLSKFCEHYDPSRFGVTPAGIANGIAANVGQGWCSANGHSLLFRGEFDSEGDVTIDYDDPVGAAAFDATTIENFAWREHDASSLYRYEMKHLGCGGQASEATADQVEIETDGAGDVVVPKPDPPVLASVVPVADGYFDVTWVHDLRFGATQPSVFNVYDDEGTGTMDFVTAIDTEAAVSGSPSYTVTVGPYADKTAVQFVVRAESAAGGESQNTDALSAVADASGPTDIDEVEVTLL